MLQNRAHGENAVFVPKADGSGFDRFHALSGRVMPVGPQDSHGLFSEDGRMYHGSLPREMALDSAEGLRPNSAGYQGPSSTSAFQPAPQLRPTSASRMGESADQGNGGGGPQKISRAAAHAIWSLAKDKISAAELDQLTAMLRSMVDPSLPDEGMEISDTHPNPHQRPHMAADAALRDARREYGLDRIGHCPPYGESVPKSKYLREAERLRRDNPSLALDARTGGAGAEETNADLREALANMAKIGRAY